MAALVLTAKPDTDGEAPLLTALLAGIYAGVVLVLGQLFGGLSAEPPTWAVAGATLAVAALFQPARRRGTDPGPALASTLRIRCIRHVPQ